MHRTSCNLKINVYNEIQMYRVMKFCVGVVMLTMACLATAGYYRVSYSLPGLAEQVGPSGTYWSGPYYHTSDGGRGGSAVSADMYFVNGEFIAGAVGRPGWAKCSGAIVAVFQWIPAYDGEPAPSTVVVRQSAYAVSSGDSGLVDNGLGDPGIPDGNGTWYSIGTHYETVSNPGGVFTRVCSPSAYGIVNTTATYPVLGASATVYYQAAAFAGQVELLGTYDDRHEDATVGQAITGSLILKPSRSESHGFPHTFSAFLHDYTWSVAGDTFKSFQANNSTGHVIPLNAGDLIVANPTWCWKAGGQNTVSGSADVEVDGVYATTISASKLADVSRPVFRFTAQDTGDSRFQVDTLGIVVGVTSGNSTSGLGIRFRGAVVGPFFPVPMIESWSFAQIVKSVRVADGGPPSGYQIDTTGIEVLDTKFPYGFENEEDTAPALGEYYFTNDTPSTPCNTSLSVADNFKMYLLVRPPNGQYAPLAYISWSWNVGCSGSGHYSNWTPVPPGVTTRSPKTDTTTHPEWDYNITDPQWYQ